MAAVLGTAVQICRAMVYLHSKDVLHGDLTPNNVLLMEDEAAPWGFSAKASIHGLVSLWPTKILTFSWLKWRRQRGPTYGCQ